MKQPYAIGSDHIPGLSKVIEEAGELGQVGGKIIGAGHMGQHWDGSDLTDRFIEEAGDVIGAIMFFCAYNNNVSTEQVSARADKKFALFCSWHNHKEGTVE